MFRRNAILLACSAIPTACLPAGASVSTPEPIELEVDAQQLADLEYRSIQVNHPETWQSISYVGEAMLNSQYAAIYCVTADQRLLGLWAGRVDRAMYPGKLRVFDLGKAGQYPGMHDGFNHVTVFVVDRKSLELEHSAFAELRAKYPEPRL